MGWYGPQTGDCSCCPPPGQQCILLVDDFNRANNDNVGANWTEQLPGSGWEISGNVLTTAVENDLITAVDGHPDGDSDLRVWARVRGAVGDQLRVVVCYVDDDNYLFGQVEIGTDCLYLTLWKRVSGSNTQLGDTMPVATSRADEWHTLVVCHQAEYYPNSQWLSARLIPFLDPDDYSTSQHLQPWIYEEVDTAESPYGGLGTGSLNAVTPIAEFDDFALWILQSPTWPQCPDCTYRTCHIYRDNFNRSNSSYLGCNWSEVTGAGSIAIETNAMKMTGGPTLAQCNIVNPSDPIAPRHAYVDCTITGAALSASLYIDYESAADYHRVCLTTSTPPSSVGLLAVYRCVGGVETLLGSAPVILPSAGVLTRLTVCMGASLITVNVAVTGDARIYTVKATTTQVGGKYAALGSSAGSYGSVVFDNFFYSLSYSADWPECPVCDFGYCGGCDNNAEPPSSIQVVFSGYTGACATLNGTYILDYSWVDSNNTKCVWLYTHGVWGDPDYASVRFQSNASTTPVLQQTVGGGMTRNYYTVAIDNDCQSWNLELACFPIDPCCAANPSAIATVISL